MPIVPLAQLSIRHLGAQETWKPPKPTTLRALSVPRAGAAHRPAPGRKRRPGATPRRAAPPSARVWPDRAGRAAPRCRAAPLPAPKCPFSACPKKWLSGRRCWGSPSPRGSSQVSTVSPARMRKQGGRSTPLVPAGRGTAAGLPLRTSGSPRLRAGPGGRRGSGAALRAGIWLSCGGKYTDAIRGQAAPYNPATAARGQGAGEVGAKDPAKARARSQVDPCLRLLGQPEDAEAESRWQLPLLVTASLSIARGRRKRESTIRPGKAAGTGFVTQPLAYLPFDFRQVAEIIYTSVWISVK